MASPNASYAAYNRLTPLDNQVTDTIRYWNQDGYARREEKRREDEAQALQKEKADAKKQALRDKIVKNLPNYDTGSRSLNEIQGRLLQKATDEYGPILKTLEDPNASEEDKLKAQLKLQEIHNLPEKLKLVTDFYTNQDAAYKTAKESGSIWENPEYEKIFQDGFENFILDLDERGNPMVAFKDTNGDGIKDFQTYDQIQTALNNGQGTFNFKKRFDIDAITTDIAKKQVGINDITTTNSGYSSEQIIEIKKDGLRNLVNRALIKTTNPFDENGRLKPNVEPTDIAISALYEKGLENTPENLKLVYDEFYKLTEDKTDFTKNQEKKPYPVSGSRSSSKSSAPSFGQGVTPTQQTWKGQYDSLDKENYYSIPVKGPKISALETGDGRTLTNANVVNYTYNKQGDLVIDVYHEDEKSSVFSKQKNDWEMLIEAYKENKSPTEEETKEFEKAKLELSKINKGVANKREVVVVSNEDEASVAQQMGLSIEEMRSRAAKDPNKPNKEKIEW